MMAASDSENDLPVFPFLGPASRHDSIGFLYNWFSMQQFLPQANVTKLLLDSAHDAMPYYEYCRDHGITPFIDLNADRGRPPVYKNDFTINNEGVPICREGHVMRRDGTESAKGRTKYKLSLIHIYSRRDPSTRKNAGVCVMSSSQQSCPSGTSNTKLPSCRALYST